MTAASYWFVTTHKIPTWLHSAWIRAKRSPLASDPREAQRLRVRMAEMLDELPEAEGATTTLTEEEIRKLRSLGYVK